MASTGGADSPARFYLFFLLVYAAYFYQRHDALPYVLSCVPVALLPLFYDSGAVEEGYIGELIVVCPAYVVLGLLIINGKELLVSLRERAEALALLDPLTELPEPARDGRLARRESSSASRPPGCSWWTSTASRT